RDWNFEGADEAARRAKKWLWSMQNDDGGWGAFDINNNREILTHVPFADHNALIDPSTSDITSRILEFYGNDGVPISDQRVVRALEFIRHDQEDDGSWYGRWGVNYIYGTWQVLKGLQAIGEDMNRPYVRRGAEWLVSVQNDDGGWGESCDSYEDPALKGIGESTPAQTAWTLLGLIAAGCANHDSVKRGVNHLLDTQRDDGGWDEQWYTGTGFPKVFYLEYTMYRHYFPTMALAAYRDSASEVF
ncbi:MAG: prenyltransferase/squalene oxidase repeat-containing protein, partial [Planctomycetota bacterium]|nr:prenyltransferase/squalene oxidase repeat-containing protein [Planctomycetota bacterium]